jgi:ATP-dependent Zn protease
MTDAEFSVWLQRSLITTLAGPVAQRRLGRSSNIRLRRAYHEAGHAVAERHVGRKVWQVSVLPQGRVGGYSFSKLPGSPAPTQDEINSTVAQSGSDALVARSHARYLAPDRATRRAYYRAARREAEQLIAEHWNDVCELAVALFRWRKLDAADIDEILGTTQSKTQK